MLAHSSALLFQLSLLLLAPSPARGQSEQIWLSKPGGQSVQSSVPTSPSNDGWPTTYITPETCASAFINYVTRLPPSQCWMQSRPNLPTEAASSVLTNAHPSDNTDGAKNSGNATLAATPPVISSSVSNSPDSPSHTVSGRSAEGPETAADNGTDSSSSVDKAPTPIVALEPTTVAVEPEPESLLDDAKFLSFEDWKKHNLPQDIPRQKNTKTNSGTLRARPDFENALEGLGDEGEIVLDFSVFGGVSSSDQVATEDKRRRESVAADKSAEQVTSISKRRSKDAGVTCKERSNYASFDCGATILKTNPEGRSASAILSENKDSYMLNTCSVDNKFLIVELCDEIKIDTVVLANYEFFSAPFRTFRVSVSDRYPVKIDKWVDIGSFEARNSRGMQAFLVEHHDGFARFVRVEFLTHYGGEFYCPISLFRVHGVTAFEEYKLEQLAADGGDADEDEEPSATVELPVEPTLPPIYVAPNATVAGGSASTTPDSVHSSLASEISVAGITHTSRPSLSTSVAKVEDEYCTSSGNDLKYLFKELFLATCKAGRPSQYSESSGAPKSSQPNQTSLSTSDSTINTASVVAQNTHAVTPSLPFSLVDNTTDPVTSTRTESSKPSLTTTLVPSGSSLSFTSSVIPSSITTVTSSSQHASTPPAPSSSSPPTQESFFKSINKRLQFLEANSTLSLQYIESQSALLRDAFAQVEKRQMGKTSTFLEILNTTVSAELSRFQSDYEQLWQSTIMELASQRDEGRRERELLGERIRMLAEEVVSQKRLMAAQATLLLLCLALVVFARFGGVANSADVSFVQVMQEIVHRGKRARAEERESEGKGWHWDSPWSSPSSRREFSYVTAKIGHDRAVTPVEDRGDDHAHLQPFSPFNGSGGSDEEISATKGDEVARRARMTRSAPTSPAPTTPTAVRPPPTPAGI